MVRMGVRYQQFRLASGHTEMVCWLQQESLLTVGRRLTLRRDDRIWTIVERYDHLLDEPPDKTWKVGGLV